MQEILKVLHGVSNAEERKKKLLDWKIDLETRKEIDRILERTIKDPVGPEFLAPPNRQEQENRKSN